jgi:hypothetical protein
MVSGTEFALRLLSVVALALPAFMILLQILGPLPEDASHPVQQYSIYSIYGGIIFLLTNGVLIVGWIVGTSFQGPSAPWTFATLLALSFLAVGGGVVHYHVKMVR